MAHTKSAVKHLHKTQKRTARSRNIKDRIKDSVKLFEKLVAEKKLDEAKAMLPKVTKLLDKAAKRHIIHKNKASRFKSKMGKKASAKA